jgi:hypothetical protein
LSKCIACQNLTSRPIIRHSTLVEHEEEVTVFDEAQTMRDHDDCHSSAKLVEGLSDQTLGSTIEGTCRLIQNKHARSPSDSPGDRQSLSLASRQGGTALSDRRLVQIGHRRHILMKVSRPRRSLNLFWGQASKEGDIERNGSLKQDGVLCDQR